jgi:hypothetical protein
MPERFNFFGNEQKEAETGGQSPGQLKSRPALLILGKRLRLARRKSDPVFRALDPPNGCAYVNAIHAGQTTCSELSRQRHTVVGCESLKVPTPRCRSAFNPDTFVPFIAIKNRAQEFLPSVVRIDPKFSKIGLKVCLSTGHKEVSEHRLAGITSDPFQSEKIVDHSLRIRSTCMNPLCFDRCDDTLCVAAQYHVIHLLWPSGRLTSKIRNGPLGFDRARVVSLDELSHRLSQERFREKRGTPAGSLVFKPVMNG